MPLPPFDHDGDLPLGIHRETLSETLKLLDEADTIVNRTERKPFRDFATGSLRRAG